MCGFLKKLRNPIGQFFQSKKQQSFCIYVNAVIAIDFLKVSILGFTYQTPFRIKEVNPTSMYFMAARVVEFSNGVYKVRKIFCIKINTPKDNY